VRGRRSPKNSGDHNPLSTSCVPHSASAAVRGFEGGAFQTCHAEIDISTYSPDQTGPKIHLGGVKSGLRSPSYQPSTELAVARPPTSATAAVAPVNPARLSAEAQRERPLARPG